jgi:hypothetical protein
VTKSGWRRFQRPIRTDGFFASVPNTKHTRIGAACQYA